jgi:uncharacterized protein (DUF427 family)
MLHDTGLLPRRYLPEADVAPGVLRPSDTAPAARSRGRRCTRARSRRRRVEDAAWSYPGPLPGCTRLAGMLSLTSRRWTPGWSRTTSSSVTRRPLPPGRHLPLVPARRRPRRRRSRRRHAEPGRGCRDGAAGALVRARGRRPRRRPGTEPDDVGLPVQGVATYEHVLVGGRGYEDAAWCYREPLLEVAGCGAPVLRRRRRRGSGHGLTGTVRAAGRRGRSDASRAATAA